MVERHEKKPSLIFKDIRYEMGPHDSYRITFYHNSTVGYLRFSVTKNKARGIYTNIENLPQDEKLPEIEEQRITQQAESLLDEHFTVVEEASVSALRENLDTPTAAETAPSFHPLLSAVLAELTRISNDSRPERDTIQKAIEKVLEDKDVRLEADERKKLVTAVEDALETATPVRWYQK